LLAREFERATDRIALFPRSPLGRLLLMAVSLDLMKHALPLQFLLENAHRLVDNVVANKNLQISFLRRVEKPGARAFARRPNPPPTG